MVPPASRRLLPLLLLLLASCSPTLALIEAPDGSGERLSVEPQIQPPHLLSCGFLFLVCFNGCSGHGNCIDYSCHCYVGYHGDDCGVSKSTTLALHNPHPSLGFVDEPEIVPILTAGDYNLTRKNFTNAITQNKMILVGFSSYSCLKVPPPPLSPLPSLPL